MKGVWSAAGWIAFAGALAVAAAAAQTPAQRPAHEPAASGESDQPTFRAGINFVRVDVIVTDRQGRPVLDLTADDFEIFEDNQPQTIETFRLVRIEGAPADEEPRAMRSRADEEAAAQRDDARIFVFFLDDYHVRLGSSLAVRRHLVEFVQQLGPADLLAVMYPLSPLDTVVLTRDHASVTRMLERFEGRKYDYTPRNEHEMRYQFYPAEVVERIRRQVSLSALEGLAIKLGGLREGRKGIILVSEGYQALLPPQLRDPIAGLPGLGNPQRGNPFAGENDPIEDRARLSASMDLQQELREVIDAANRHNTTIYAVDPRGLSGGEFDVSQNVSPTIGQAALGEALDTLRTLAGETDGRAIVNRNDLARGMAQIIRDASAYYLIGYSSTQAPDDGKFHAIRVRVKRPGVQVRARKGYWALTAAETARALAPKDDGPPADVTAALAALAEHGRARVVRTWAGTAIGPGGQPQVTFVWEPVPPPPGTRERPVAARVTLVATAADGEVLYRGPVPAEAAPDAAGGQPAASVGWRSAGMVAFPARPGRLTLRLTVEDAAGVLDREDRDLLVPDLTAPEVRLGTPRLHVARTVPEFRALVADLGAPPTASREFRRTDRVLVRVDAFAPAGLAPEVTARLLNRSGQAMSDLAVAPPPRPGAPFTAELALAAVPPGEYLLELAAGAGGHEPVREVVAFRVGS